MGRGLDSFTVKEAEEYLNGIPKFTRKKHSIEELREILDETGLSLDGVRLIHVAGTNGKGSVCAFFVLDSQGSRGACGSVYLSSPGFCQRAVCL